MFNRTYSLMVSWGVACIMLAACSNSKPPASEPASQTYDLVIEGGRVMDPESGLDAVKTIGILDGRIAAISDTGLAGEHITDASGMVVAPGFIDIHSHSPTPLGAKYQVLDGVTTQLDLEAGAFPVSAYGFMIKGQSPLNFGNSISHLAVRTKVIEGLEKPYLFTQDGPMKPGAAFVKPATAGQIDEMRALLIEGLDQGGIGIGVLLDYISAAVSKEELRMVFEVAGERSAPVTVHVRRGLPGDPAGLIDVIELAEQTGAPLLICHITHSAMQALPQWLKLIDAANARGAKITTETLSYAAGGTSIGAAVFHRDWQKIFDITYADVQWTATGEWLTEETFKAYQAEEPSGMVNHHYVKEEWVEAAIRWPGMMVSSDVTPAMTEDVLSNPNLAGTFARFIGHYARDRQQVSIMDALARVSLYPARWLEQIAPKFETKGRIKVGMDADIVIFDLAGLQAKADYGAPYRASEGIKTVIVGGVPVARDGALIAGAAPGKHILAGKR